MLANVATRAAHLRVSRMSGAKNSRTEATILAGGLGSLGRPNAPKRDRTVTECDCDETRTRDTL